SNTKVLGVVDANLGPQHPSALVVLLEEALLVEDLQAAHDALPEEPGFERPRRVPPDLAVEDDLEHVRPAQMQVVPQQLFIDTVEDLGAVEDHVVAELRLIDRQMG